MDTDKFEVGDFKKLFLLVQDSSACHVKYSTILRKWISKNNVESNREELQNIIQHIFQQDYKQKNIYVERLIDFLVLLITSFNVKDNREENLIFTELIEFVLQSTRLIYETVRYWSCKLIGKICARLDEIDLELYSNIQEAMMERIQEPRAAIRFQAILSVAHLQDIEDSNDPIMKEFVKILSSDPNPKVRQLCVEKVSITRDALMALIDRVRDVDVNVRLTAFKRFCKLVTYLTISHRRLVLKCGFLDESAKIKEFIKTEFIPSWLECYNNDYIALMKSLRLDACEEDIKETVFLTEHLLTPLFKTSNLSDLCKVVQLNEEKLIEYKDLNWESILFYRLLIQHLRSHEEFEFILELILPDLVKLCKHVEDYCRYSKENQDEIDYLQRQFILHQFFLITMNYDMGDAAGRQSINELSRTILYNEELTEDVAEAIEANLELTIPSVSMRSSFIYQIIFDIIYEENCADNVQIKNEEHYAQLAKIKDQLLRLRNEQETKIAAMEFAEAANIETEIVDLTAQLNNLETISSESIGKKELEKQTDPASIKKYLTVAIALLKSASINELNPLFLPHVQGVVIHPDPEIKVKAFLCYALCCIADKTTAIYGIHIFSLPISAYQGGQACDPCLLIVCMKAIVDLLRLYGSELIAEPIDDDNVPEDEVKPFTGGTSLTDILQGFAELLEDELIELQTTAAVGICRLLYSSRIRSASLLSRLIVKWASPATDNTGKIKQVIGFTLQHLPNLPTFEESFPDAVITTIRTLVLAPKDSPLKTIKLDAVTKFMLALLQTSPKGYKIRYDLALKLCSLMMDQPSSELNLAFSKILATMSSCIFEKDVEELLDMCDMLRDNLRKKQVINNLIKFTSALNKNTEE